MAKFAVTDATINVNGSDLSNHCSQATLSMQYDVIDASAAMTTVVRESAPGSRTDSITLTLNQDYDPSTVDAVLWPLFAAGVSFPVVITPTSKTTSSTNPAYQMTGWLENYAPLDGTVGAAAVVQITIACADSNGITRSITPPAVSPTVLPGGPVPLANGQMVYVRSDGTTAWLKPMAVSARAWGMHPSYTSSVNSTALQAACNQAALNLGAGGTETPGGNIDIPGGTYAIQRGVLIRNGMRLRGVGSGSGTVLQADNTVALSNWMNGTQGAGSNQPRIGQAPVGATSSGLTTAAAITSIPVANLAGAIPSGMQFTTISGSHTQTWTTTGAVSPGATSIPVSSQTPNFAYPTGTMISVPQPAMIRHDGGDQWCHRVQVSGIKLDVNGVAGLSGMWFQYSGETSVFDDLTCNNTVPVPRTVADAQITSTSNIVTFTASTIVEDDVGALVTDRTDGDHTQAGPTIPAWTRIDRVNYTTLVGLPVTALSVTLNKAATASAANSSFTIKQPTAAYIWDGGAARGHIGSLNAVTCFGPAVWFRNFGSGTMLVDSLSGDDNFNMVRITRASQNVDPCHITIKQIKSESDSYNTATFAAPSMDPSVLLDRCGAIGLNIMGGSFISNGARDVVRVDQPINSAVGGGAVSGGPSIELAGVEGANWYNTQYTNIIRCPDTGDVITVNDSVRNAYPKIYWNRDIIMGGFRLQIGADGKLQWGPGAGGALDTNLYRSASATLATDMTFAARVGTAQATQLGWDVLNATAFAAASFGTDTVFRRINPGQMQLNNQLQLKLAAPTYGTTVTPAMGQGCWHTVTVTNATAFTIAAASNPPDANHTATITIEVSNTSGGAMGVITWAAIYAFNGFTWTNPATGKKRWAEFGWNGSAWVCKGVAQADY